MDRQG